MMMIIIHTQGVEFAQEGKIQQGDICVGKNEKNHYILAYYCKDKRRLLELWKLDVTCQVLVKSKKSKEGDMNMSAPKFLK